MATVVDASVFMKWYLRDERLIHQATLLLAAFETGVEPLVCPQFARYELVSALTKAIRNGRISDSDAREAMNDFAALGIVDRSDDDGRLSQAGTFARRYDVSFYDALYMALAEEIEARLVTADDKFYEQVEHADVLVTHLSDLR